MAIDKTLCQQMIDACITAEINVLAGKTVSFQGRSVARENLAEIRAARQEWERKLAVLNRGRRPAYKLVRF